MTTNELSILLPLLFLAAMLYSSVGHAGASAYLAAMALLSVSPAIMKPTALALNICVASFVFLRYVRGGLWEPRIAVACIIGSAPFAFIGGVWTLPGHYYKPLLGIMLLLGAIRLLWPQRKNAEAIEVHPPKSIIATSVGAGIGLLSGLTGTGGGIFLSPILIFMRWVDIRKTLGTASLFILCNSVAGLAGNIASVGKLPNELPWMILTVMCGALLGTWLGISRLNISGLQRALGGVLIIASGKLLLVA
jgi:uncharacterized membrane protein YfcA